MRSVPRLMGLAQRGKKLLLVIAAVLVALPLADLTAGLFYRILRGERPPLDDCRQAQVQLAGEPQDVRLWGLPEQGGAPKMTFVQDGPMALHPYLGYVLEQGEGASGGWGFGEVESPVQPARPDVVVVGIFGGSFARGLFVHGADRLADWLGRVPRFAGKRVTVVPIAIGGYKQPQQFLALGYLLSLARTSTS